MTFSLFFLFLVLIQGFCFSGCSQKSLYPLTVTQHPHFSDDLGYTNLDRAIEQSLIYLRKQPPVSEFTLGDQVYPLSRLIRSLEFFRNILLEHPSPTHLTRQINAYFTIYQAAGTSGYNPQRNMLVTGYYQPIFSGSLVRKEPYIYPIYSIPDTLALRRNSISGIKEIGRLEGSIFKKYWTRGEIDNHGYARGNELVYLQDPFDAFLLHVQGSGLITLPDGSIRGIHYAMKNGHPYNSIGKYMVNTGKLPLAEASIDSIRAYISTHPEERQQILHRNPSFIFFQWTTNHGAIGNLGRELTPGRSIAGDQTLFPAGALSFLVSRIPVIDKGRVIRWQSLARFVLVQDKGSAIRGSGRIDLFCGSGKNAGLIAGRMKEDGALYVLLLKKQFL